MTGKKKIRTWTRNQSKPKAFGDNIALAALTVVLGYVPKKTRFVFLISLSSFFFFSYSNSFKALGLELYN
jgi:hypothetical protein